MAILFCAGIDLAKYAALHMDGSRGCRYLQHYVIESCEAAKPRSFLNGLNETQSAL